MGTTLTGTTPQDTYDSLIKVTDNGPLSATGKYLSDGLGNDSVLALSTTAVGVGTATPASALHVLGTQFRIEANDPTITLKRNVEAAFGGHIDWLTNDNTIGFQIANNALVSASFLEFNYSGVNRMVIKSDGNVGIGTDAPESKLHVAGTSSGSDVTLYIDNTAGSALNNSTRLKFSSDTGSSVSNGGAELNCINVNAGDGAVDLLVKSWTGAAYTEKARFLAGGGLTFNGDTAAANALDDYEEGTFTPSVAFGGGSTGITYFDRVANYTKIGRQVYVQMYVALTNKGTDTGNATITGLPFAVGSLNRGSVGAVALDFADITFTGQMGGQAGQSATQITFTNTSEAGSRAVMTNSNFTDVSQFWLNITYNV